MKKIYCDFCGKELNVSPESWLKNILKPAIPPARDTFEAQLCSARDTCHNCAKDIKSFMDALEKAYTIVNMSPYYRDKSTLKPMAVLETTIRAFIMDWLQRQDREGWLRVIAAKRKSFDFTKVLAKD